MKWEYATIRYTFRMVDYTLSPSNPNAYEGKIQVNIYSTSQSWVADSLPEAFNFLGSRGFELVSSVDSSSDGMSVETHYFKRAVSRNSASSTTAR